MSVHLLESGKRLSQSRLWQWQRTFFDRQGLSAWNGGGVPHYITSNLFIADAYAQVVRAHAEDCPDGPLTIVELAAGNGRFAYHFLSRFLAAHRRSAQAARPVVYVMTDFSERTLEGWRAHPQLAALAHEGVLDFARFDLEHERELELRISGRRISAAAPATPLVAIANYCFDSIAADAFAIEGGALYECLATLTSNREEPDLDDPGILERVELSYEKRPVSPDFYPDARWNQILRGYAERLHETAIGFPIRALAVCDLLSKLAGGRLLLLTSDKGKAHESALLDQVPPRMSWHGSFSLSVNYHAIAELFRGRGGHALCLPHGHSSLATCAFLLGEHARSFPATRQAFTSAIEDFGPDDFFAIKKAAEVRLDELTVEQILSLMRLSRHDSRWVGQCAKALFPRVPKLSVEHKHELLRALRLGWQSYFHLDETDDLAFTLGALALQMGFPRDALPYCQSSLERYGPDSSTLYNLALCHADLGEISEAIHFTRETLACDPKHPYAHAMLARLEAAPGGGIP